MQLVAPASKTVRNKNLLIVVLCAVFAGWFGYDGWIGWPASNDKTVDAARNKYMGTIPEQLKKHVQNWAGWNESNYDEQKIVSEIITGANINTEVKWHSPLDIIVQKVITVSLFVLTGVALWWVLHCQKRCAAADDNALSPAPGLSIPWEAITKVDNTRWKKSGIVYVTYTDPAGPEKRAVLDDYLLDDLRPILQELASRAHSAEFIPRPDAPSDASTPSA